MRILDLLVLLMLAVALGFGGYVFWMNLPGQSVEYKPFNADWAGTLGGNGVVNASNSIVQFYPNMRFTDESISYRLESICPKAKWDDIRRAFDILSERTVLSFYESRDNPEIIVLCSEVMPKAEEEGHFIAGEGGPSEIISTRNYALIRTGKISLYKREKCEEPKIALHEILHALGFDHYNNSMSILYPITGCDQEIDQEIIQDINQLYKEKAAPDLMIESIIANSTGKYLNFDINISNEGLINSIGAELEVYAENERVANFTFGKLEVGMKKMMFVQNVKIPSGSESIDFVIKSKDSEEMSLLNNRAEISIAWEGNI